MSTAEIYDDMISDAETHDAANTSLSTVICPRTAQILLNRLGYKYTDIKKKVFLDSHKRPDVVKDRHYFLTEMCHESNLPD